MRKRKILELVYEFCSWPEAGLLHPALSPAPSLSRHLLWVLASRGRARVRPGGRVRTAQPSSSLLGSLVRGRAALAAWSLCGRREDMCACGGVHEDRACLTLLPLRNEALRDCPSCWWIGTGSLAPPAQCLSSVSSPCHLSCVQTCLCSQGAPVFRKCR